MPQRTLKVKVTAELDSTFKKLLSQLDKTSKLKVKIDVDDGGLSKLLKSLDSLKSKKVDVGLDVDDSKLKKLQNELDGISKSKNTKVNVDSDSSGLSKIDDELDRVIAKEKQVDGSKVTIYGDASAIGPLVETLDSISDKILNISKSAIAPFAKDTISDAKDLYDSQKSFAIQMKAAGKSAQWVAEQQEMINKYGSQSKYSVAEMVDAYAQFVGSGKDDPAKLLTGIAGISSYAKNASKAMKSVNTQINQMTADGYVMTGDWNAIQNAIGGTAAKALKDWLKLNKGIDASKKNLQDSVLSNNDFLEAVRAVGNEDAYQNMAKQSNTLSSAVDNMRESLTTALVGTDLNPGPIVGVMDTIVKKINELGDAIPSIVDKITQGVNQFKDLVKTAFGSFDVKTFVTQFSSSFKILAPILKAMAVGLSAITNNGKNLGSVTGKVIAFAAAWKLVRSQVNAASTAIEQIKNIKDATSAITNKIPKFSGKKSKGNIPSVPDTNILVPTKSPKVPKINAKDYALTGLTDFAKQSGTILAVAASLKIMTSAFKDISTLDVDYGQALENVAAMATFVGTMGGSLYLIGKALNKFPKIQEDLLVGAVAAGGVAKTILVIAQQVSAFSKIKIKGENAAKNLLKIGAIVSASATAIGLIGAAILANPEADIALGVGATAIIAVLGSMILVEKELQSLAKNITSLNKAAKDLPSVSDFVSSMGKLTTELGALTLTSVGTGLLGVVDIVTGVLNGLGALGTAITTVSIESEIKNIAKLNDIAKSLPNDSDLQTSVSKIFKLGDVIAQINGAYSATSFQSIVKGANPFVQLDNAINSFLDSATISNIVNSLEKLVEFKNKIENVEVPNLDNVQKKIKQLFEIRNQLIGVGTFEFSDIPVLSQLVSLSNWINDSLNAGSIDAVIKSMKSIIDFKNKLDSVEIPEVSSIKDKLSNLKNIANELNVLLNNGESGNIFTVFGSLFNSWTTGNNAGSIKSALDAINSTIDTINKISKLKDIDKEGIQTKLNQIKEAIKSLDFKLPHITKVDDGNLKALTSIKKVLSDFTSITDSLNAFNPVDLSDKVEQIKQALLKLSELATPDLYQPFSKDLGDNTKNASTFFTAFKTISDGLTSLAAVPDLTDVQSRLEQIKTAINNIKESGIAETLSSFAKKDVAKGGDSAKSLISSIVDIANTLSTLTVQIDETAIQTSINSVKNVLNSLVSGDNNFVEISQKLGKSKADFSLAKQMIDSVTEVVNSINAMPIVNAETWQTNAPQIMSVLSGMKTMSGYLEEVATLNQKVIESKTTFTSLNDLINTINSLGTVNEGASGTISSLKDILNQLSTIDINTNFSTQIARHCFHSRKN